MVLTLTGDRTIVTYARVIVYLPICPHLAGRVQLRLLRELYMEQYKAAIIGCGSRAPAHIDAYRHIDNAKVTACCAPTAGRRDALAAKYQLKAYADPAEMIRIEQPDIVHLVTWPKTRVELMSLVSDLGVPLCTVEKPIACGVSDWQQLSKLSKITKTRIAICHQFRWQTDLMRCQSAVASGQLGDVKFLDISAGMNISGQGTHTLNYGRSLLGNAKIARVFGNAAGFSGDDAGHPAPDTTAAHLLFDNGVRGLWTSGSVSPRYGSDPTAIWQHVRVAAYADRGRVNYEEFGKWEIVGPKGKLNGDWGGWESWGAANQQAQARFHKAMFGWLENGTPPGTSLEESLHEWAVVLAVYQSALIHQPIDLATFSPPADLFDQLQKALQPK